MDTDTGPRKWMFGLTADEWLHLAGEGHGSEVAPCCGDIGALREWLNCLATRQGEGEAFLLCKPTLEAYEAASSDHDSLLSEAGFPLLHRVLAGVRAAMAEEERQVQEYRAAIAARGVSTDDT